MKLLQTFSALVLAAHAPFAAATASWGFTDASLTVQSKGGGVGGGAKEKLSESSALPKNVDFGAQDTLKIILTLQDGKTAKRPHQAFLNLLDPVTELETSFPFVVKESGKAKVELTHKDIPIALLQTTTPLTASIFIGSFGSTKPYNSQVFSLNVKLSASSPAAVAAESPLRYGKLPEIHHIFKPDPNSPPLIITLFFSAAVVVALPALFGSWLFLGANANHLSKALNQAPLAHTLYYGSIVAMEGLFFMYYTTWNLFRVLPVALGIGAVIFFSGSRALSEVQERRLAGLR